MQRLALVALLAVVTACDPNGTCENRDEHTCAETLKSNCTSGTFISNARCSTLGYRYKDARGTWTKN